MKFKYIGPSDIVITNGIAEEVPANSYGGAKVMPGDVVELEGWLASKALANPNYELVKKKPGPKPKEDKVLEPQAITV
jgi:hypothetical protein